MVRLGLESRPIPVIKLVARRQSDPSHRDTQAPLICRAPVALGRRECVALQFDEQLIGERYPLQHEQPIYRERLLKPGRVFNSERVVGRVISCPTFPYATRSLVKQYVTAFRKVFEHAYKELGPFRVPPGFRGRKRRRRR